MNPELAKRILAVPFPFQTETWERRNKPTQICLHHTASGPGVDGDINWWRNDGQPVSTPLVVGRNGIAAQLYSSMRWGFNLGLSHNLYKVVEEATIGLEIDTWGYLELRQGRFYSWTGQEVPANDVCTLATPHRGMKYFHKYTPEQIETVRLLLLHWNQVYGIPLDFKGQELFNVSTNAQYARVPGIYSHNSFRQDKTDIHPQLDMVAMLKGLGK